MAAASVLAASGCSGAGAGDGSRLTVLAAASLTESFEELEATFEAEHPEVDVTLVLDSSSSLAEQVRQGAPGDVLATADEQTMESVVDAAATDGPVRRFASNRIVLAVPAGPDATVRRVEDLVADPSLHMRGDYVLLGVPQPEAVPLTGATGVVLSPNPSWTNTTASTVRWTGPDGTYYSTRSVTAVNAPTESPEDSRPVSLAAPKMVEVAG